MSEWKNYPPRELLTDSGEELAKAEDAAHSSGEYGIMLLAVRKDTAAALAGTDADYIPLIVDASGRLHVAPLAAGSNAIGKLATNSGVDIGDVDILSIAAGNTRIGTMSGVCKTVSVTKALESASAYEAEDVLSESDTDGEGTAWTFSALFRANNTGGYITKAVALCETTAITPRLTLFLFHTAPTCELDDHAANTAVLHADEANFVGSIDFPAMEDLGTGDSQAIATPSTVGNLPLWVDAASDADDLIGVLVTRDVFTNTATNDIIIKLTLEQY